MYNVVDDIEYGTYKKENGKFNTQFAYLGIFLLYKK